jgi:hypothetical protein
MQNHQPQGAFDDFHPTHPATRITPEGHTMMTGTPESVTFVPISRIEVLNSRDRNMKVFEEIVDNIRNIGLKKPITVTERPGHGWQAQLPPGLWRRAPERLSHLGRNPHPRLGGGRER